MTPAEHARNNAITFECKKDSLRQKQSGDWTIAFTVQSIDMDERLTKAAPGTRFVAVLVEVGENEEPVQRKEDKTSPRSTPATRPEPDKPLAGKRDWRDLQPQQQAGIRCSEPVFVAFLKETHPIEWRESEEAAACVRLLCGVHSRVELGTNHAARVAWHQLDSEFVAWKALEHA